MFADACEKAMRFTRPVIVSTRCVDGSTHSMCGSYIVINRDGWILTAGHVFAPLNKFREDQKKIKEIDDIIAKEGEHPNLKKDGSWLTNISIWWGQDNINFTDAFVDLDTDMAVARLTGFRPEMIREYPVFKDPEDIRIGSSICRIGFPFVDSTTDFDEKEQRFCIRKGVVPMPFFPNDGMISQFVNTGMSNNNKYEKLYVETTTPGLMGQSGGPIFDKKGHIVALQVRTMHMPLGFSPAYVDENGKKVVENQFMNVGVGVHVKTIMKMLDDLSISYDSETNDKGFRIVG